MAVQVKNPTSPGSRGKTVLRRPSSTQSKPLSSLVEILPYKAGRNNNGRITCRHKGGRNKRYYRLIDFKRRKLNVEARVLTIEYDPNRSCSIALVCYADGQKAYVLRPEGLNIGDAISNGPESEINIGNAMPLRSIPMGTQVHNIELYPEQGGTMVRAAGTSAQLVAKEGKYATLKLPSGEMRKVLLDCYATIGVLDNSDRKNTSLGKAGANRHRGKRPTVRGSVMNPCDHPHGGGEGKAPVGRPSPVTPWGKPTLGYRTRSKKKASSKLIVKRRYRK